MILQLLNLLFVSLGLGYDKPVVKNSLYPKREPEVFSFNINPITLVVLMFLGMILFALIVFLFMPGTESGLVYNKAYL